MVNTYKIPIFVYHRILDDDAILDNIPPGNRPYCSRLSEFTAQMNCLRATGHTGISVSQIHETKTNKVVGLTFDDGLESDFKVVLPEIKKLGFYATFYVITNYVGKTGYMDWTQIKELQYRGMEIGSHSVSHRCLLDLTNKEILKELSQSKKEIEDHLGELVESFSVPFGFVNQKIIETAFDVGYKTVCTSKTSLAATKAIPRVYGRFGIRKNDKIETFQGIIEKKRFTLLKINLMEQGKDYLKGILGRRVWLTFREKLLSKRF